MRRGSKADPFVSVHPATADDDTNLDKSSILYDCPLMVCENIMCVRGNGDGSGKSGGAGVGLLRTSCRGVSLIPRMMCAGESVGCDFAPACLGKSRSIFCAL